MTCFTPQRLGGITSQVAGPIVREAQHVISRAAVGPMAGNTHHLIGPAIVAKGHCFIIPHIARSNAIGGYIGRVPDPGAGAITNTVGIRQAMKETVAVCTEQVNRSGIIRVPSQSDLVIGITGSGNITRTRMKHSMTESGSSRFPWRISIRR